MHLWKAEHSFWRQQKWGEKKKEERETIEVHYSNTDLAYWNCKIKRTRLEIYLHLRDRSFTIQCNWNNSGINWKINFLHAAHDHKLARKSREITSYRSIYIYVRQQNYCQTLMYARQRRDTVALLIFIKQARARTRVVSFLIILPPQQAHNENKISCLNFTGIITKRRRCHVAEKYSRGVMTDIRAQTSSGGWKKKKKKRGRRHFCTRGSFRFFLSAKRET